MKRKLLVLLLCVNLFANGEIISDDLVKIFSQDINSTKFLNFTNKYLNNLESTEPTNMSELLNKMKYVTKNSINTIKNKVIGFDLQKAQVVTYKIKVYYENNSTKFSTAVALTPNGTLITTYHNIKGFKRIEAVDFKGKIYPAKIGNVSLDDDLAYVLINASNIPFAKLAKDVQLGQEFHLLSYENLLLKGIVSQIKPRDIVLNISAKNEAYGAGVFNEQTELLSIVIESDLSYNTSKARRINTFKDINQIYNINVSNESKMEYDTSYCYSESEQKIWDKYAKSKNLKLQELHAIFIGLCKKVENKDLTSEKAKIIFETSRKRLLEL